MYKLLCILPLCLFAHAGLLAQTIYAARIGANYNEYTGINIPVDIQPRLGINAGLQLDYDITYNVSFVAEIEYSQKGAKFEEPILNQKVQATLSIDERMDYIAMHPMLRIYFQGFNGLYTITGLDLSFLAGQKKNNSAIFNGIAIDADIYYNYTPRTIVPEAVFGTGFMYYGWITEARFTWGLLDIYTEHTRDIRNTFLTVSVGYFFNYNDRLSRRKNGCYRR